MLGDAGTLDTVHTYIRGIKCRAFQRPPSMGSSHSFIDPLMKLVEPPNKGHYGANDIVPCREVVPISEVK